MKARMTGLRGALLLLGAVATLGTVYGPASAAPFVDPRSEQTDAIDANPAFAREPRDPACQARTLVSTGGASPRNPNTLAVRWIGFSNFELVYKGRILLLDA